MHASLQDGQVVQGGQQHAGQPVVPEERLGSSSNGSKEVINRCRKKLNETHRSCRAVRLRQEGGTVPDSLL